MKDVSYEFDADGDSDAKTSLPIDKTLYSENSCCKLPLKTTRPHTTLSSLTTDGTRLIDAVIIFKERSYVK